MQLGFYFDQSRCIGCFACVVACKDWHDIQDKELNWIKLLTLENGKYPDVSVNFLVLNCYHCAKPACMEACPVGAIRKRAEDGIVLIDREQCTGINACGLCREACPYRIPQFGSETNAKAEMCHFCSDRWAEKRKPVCVEACPVEALDAGAFDELQAKYGSTQVAVGFDYVTKLQPSVIFGPSL